MEGPELDQQYLALGIEDMVSNDQYDDAIARIREIHDPQTRLAMCIRAIMHLSVLIAAREFGKITWIRDPDEYEKAKLGMGECCPHTALYIDQQQRVRGIEDMTDLVPSDNPLVQFLYEIQE